VTRHDASATAAAAKAGTDATEAGPATTAACPPRDDVDLGHPVERTAHPPRDDVDNAGPRDAVERAARPPRADAVRNRARVLAAASEAFAADGLAVPLDEIARRAGVGAGTVYRHFPTKEALFEAVITDRLAALADDAEARLASAEDPGEAFFGFFYGTIYTGLAKADLAEALASAGAGLSEELQRASIRLRHGLDGLLKRAQDAGAVRADVSVEDLHALAKGAMAAEKRAETDPNIERGKMTRVICDGLRA